MNALCDIESLLWELNSITDLIDGLAIASKDIVITTGPLVLIRDQLRERHKNLKDMWLRAWDEHHAECREYEAALAAAKAKRGSTRQAARREAGGGALGPSGVLGEGGEAKRSVPATLPDDVGDAGGLGEVEE